MNSVPFFLLPIHFIAWGLSAIALWVGASGTASAMALELTATNASTCRVDLNAGTGSVYDYTLCRGATSAAVVPGHIYNDTSAVIADGGSSASLEIDSGVLSDAGSFRGGRIRLFQFLQWNFSLDVQVDPGVEWEIVMDQSASGLFAIVDEGEYAGGSATPGAGQLINGFFSGQDIFVSLAGSDYDVDITPDSTGFTDSTTSWLFTGGRSDTITGTGPTLLSGSMTTTLQAYSFCLAIGCTSGDEAAILFGLDDVGAPLSTNPDAFVADNYATWGRSADLDGYTASFKFAAVPVPAAVWLFGSGVAGLGLAGARRRTRRSI